MAKTKLVDVAKRAGISNSTVSQYLNGRFDYMSENTKQRIQAAIEELNYVPNAIARSLKTDKTKTIGVIVRDVTGYYTSRAIRGIDDYCKNNGYNVIIYNTDFDSKTEARSIEALNQLSVDGIIIAPSGENSQLINDVESKKLPIVQFQLEHDDSEKSIIISDYRKASYDATEYLIKLGHKRICFVTQNFSDVKSREERYLGYTEALIKHGIPVDQNLILYWQRKTGFSEIPIQFLRSEIAPTAFFTQHLAITTHLLDELNQANIKIPEQVSLLGFDEVPLTKFFKVPITVIQQNPYQIGFEAAKLLLQKISNKPHNNKITIPCTLTIRASCRNLSDTNNEVT